MTSDEAKLIVALAREAAAMQDLPDMHVREMERRLLPLPFAACRRNVERWAVMPKLDADGRQVAKFCSSVSDVLDACGVTVGARPLLAMALERGGTVHPSLRGTDGWEYVPDGDPIPLGVAEMFHLRGEALPQDARVAVAALGPGAERPHQLHIVPRPEVVTGHLQTISARLAEVNQQAAKYADKWRVEPPALAEFDRDRMPDVLRNAVVAAEKAYEDHERARQRVEAQRAAYDELCDDMNRRILERAPDAASARQVATELLQRLMADPLAGFQTCCEVFRDAVAPGLTITTARCEYDAAIDFEGDEPRRVNVVRLALNHV